MEKYTASISKGHGNYRHNVRTQDKLPKNVDPERMKDNIYLLDRDVKELYHELFDEAVRKYNEGKPARRQIENYYSKVFKEARTQAKTFHELVIQIGNKDHYPGKEISDQIYRDFYEYFKKSFDHMPVFCCVIHNDESTPHMHLDFVPWRDGRKVGLEKAVSFNGALMQSGFEDYMSFRAHLFGKLEELMKEHDLERDVLGNDFVHIESVARFKKVAEKISQMEKEYRIQLESERNRLFSDLDQQILSHQSLLKELETTSQKKDQQVRVLEVRIADLMEQTRKLERDYEKCFSTLYQKTCASMIHLKESLEMDQKFRQSARNSDQLIKQIHDRITRISSQGPVERIEQFFNRDYAQKGFSKNRIIGQNDFEQGKRMWNEHLKELSDLFYSMERLSKEVSYCLNLSQNELSKQYEDYSQLMERLNEFSKEAKVKTDQVRSME